MSTSLLNSRSSFCPAPLSPPLSLPLSQIKIKSFLTMMGMVRRPRNLSGKGSSTTAPTTDWALPFSFSLPLSLSLSLSHTWRHLRLNGDAPAQQSTPHHLLHLLFSPSFSLFFSLFPLFFHRNCRQVEMPTFSSSVTCRVEKHAL